jgi:iron complex transport system permease protein
MPAPAAGPKAQTALFALLLAGLLAVVLWSSGMGSSFEIPLATRLGIVAGELGLSSTEATPAQRLTVLQIRLPRIVLGLVVGAALAVAGAALQGLFRNPLADPGLIGVSSGSALAVIILLVGANHLPGLDGAGWLSGTWAQALFAMAGGAATTLLVYRMARVGGRTQVASLLLMGIAVNAVAGAIIGLLLHLADAQQMRTFIFWSLGQLRAIGWSYVWPTVLLVLPLTFGLLRYARALNAFVLGEAEACHLGYATQRVKRTIIILAAGLVGVSVAVAGIIGFVGLVVPHIARLLFGPDHRMVLPASALLGALLLVLADIPARTLFAPEEVAIGVVTALVGGVFFFGLLLVAQRKPLA